MEKGQKTNGVFTLSASGPHPFKYLSSPFFSLWNKALNLHMKISLSLSVYTQWSLETNTNPIS